MREYIAIGTTAADALDAFDAEVGINVRLGADVRVSTGSSPRSWAEVAYVETTPDGQIRHASFVRMRGDRVADSR